MHPRIRPPIASMLSLPTLALCLCCLLLWVACLLLLLVSWSVMRWRLSLLLMCSALVLPLVRCDVCGFRFLPCLGCR